MRSGRRAGPTGSPPPAPQTPERAGQVRLVADGTVPALNPAAAAVLARIVRAHLARRPPAIPPTNERLAIRSAVEGSSGP